MRFETLNALLCSFFVDLSAVTDPALVPSAIAQALGVPEVAGRPILEAVKTQLHDQELLLVVDNFEQVAAAGSVIEELLMAAPKLKALVTSRVVLSLRGEQEYAVPPLEPPHPERLPDILTLGRFEAVRLFTERAVAVQPGFRVTEENASDATWQGPHTLGSLDAAEKDLLEAHPLFVSSRGERHKETRECVQALVALYSARQAAEPGGGWDREVSSWSAKLRPAAPPPRAVRSRTCRRLQEIS